MVEINYHIISPDMRCSSGTVPENKNYPTGAVPVNKYYPTGTAINKLSIFSSKSTLFRAFHGCVCLAAPNRSYVTQRRCQKSTSRIGYRSTLRLFSWRTSRRTSRSTPNSCYKSYYTWPNKDTRMIIYETVQLKRTINE